MKASEPASTSAPPSASATAFTTTSEFRFRLQRRLSCCDVYVSAGKVNELYRGEVQQQQHHHHHHHHHGEDLRDSYVIRISIFALPTFVGPLPLPFALPPLLSVLQSLRQYLPMYTKYIRIHKGYIVVMLSFLCPPPRDFRLATLELCFVC